jgi:hypothetical protein
LFSTPRRFTWVFYSIEKKRILWIRRNILPLTVVAALCTASLTFSFTSTTVSDAAAVPCSTFSVTTAAGGCVASSVSDPCPTAACFNSSDFCSP